jgi:hypothetical protein
MATDTIDVLTAITAVESAVEKVINDADQNFPEAATIGDAVRQGDLYIQLIEPFTGSPEFYTKVKNPAFPIQLAPGNTKGSRHLLEGSADAEIWICDAAKLSDPDFANSNDLWEFRNELEDRVEKFAMKVTGETEDQARTWSSESRKVGDSVMSALVMSGPIMVLKNKTTISHPEHGNWILPPGAYRVAFQRTVDSEMRVRRVFD